MLNISEIELYTIKRRQKGITLTKLAEEINFNQSSLSRYELGKRQLKPSTIKAYQAYIDTAK